MLSAQMRRSRLEEFKSQAEVIEDDIRALESQRRALKLQIKAKQALLDEKRREMAPLAPVYTLSEDVVALILKAAYQHEFPHCRRDDGLPYTHSPVAISHVSRWWRAQALSIPSIWSCIHVTANQPQGHEEVVKAYLVRSRHLPLSISFQCKAPHEYDEDTGDGADVPWDMFKQTLWPRFKASWRYLITERHRWKDLALYLFYEQAAQVILKSLQGSSLKGHTFPSLEYLGISVDFPLPLVLRLGQTPKLKHFRSDNVSTVLDSRADLFEHLTELTLHHVEAGIDTIMQTLGRCSDTLTTLTLSHFNIHPHDHPFRPIPQVTLSKLTCLSLIGIQDAAGVTHEPHGVAIVLRSAPAVETLRLGFGGHVVPVLSSGQVIMPSVRLLQYAEPFDHEFDIRSSRNFFLSLPGIEVLQVSGEEFSMRLQHAMAIDQESDNGCTAWPDLHTLMWKYYEAEELEGLHAFIEHRSEIKKPLRRLVLSDRAFSMLDTETLDAFKTLKLDVKPFSEMLPEAATPSDEFWDYEEDGPILEPWHGVWHMWDQF